MAMSFNEWLQSRLTAHGFPVGPIDGIIGELTLDAMEAFQRSKLLQPSRKADAATVAALRGSASAISDGTPPVDRAISDVSVVLNDWPRQSDVARYYGTVGKNQTHIMLPFPMKLSWNHSQVINKMTLHEKVARSAERCFERIANAYTFDEIEQHGFNLFGGSLNVRLMRGGSRYSMHSWGIAIDFDPTRNQLKWTREKAHLAKVECAEFWRIWESEGWVSLGRERDYDWMHVQAARL